MPGCVAPRTGVSFLSGTLDFLDCQSRDLGAAGYQALALTGSPVNLAVTSLLTIFVAYFGIRLLLGDTVGVRDSIVGVAKIGLVLTLAASWPAWRTIGYDVVFDAPTQVADLVGASTETLSPRLQAVDDGILSFTLFGAGRLDRASEAEGTFTALQLQRTPPISDDLALGLARVSFLATTIGAFGGLRIVGALLLALAPLFAGFLLFDSTRALFVGWVRGLCAIAIGMLTATLILVAELSLLEPWLSDALTQRGLQLATPAAPIELFALALAFALMQAIGLGLVTRLCFMVSLPGALSGVFAAPGRAARGIPPLDSDVGSAARRAAFGSLPAGSRALSIADAVATSQQRDAGSAVSASIISQHQGRSPQKETMIVGPAKFSARRTGLRKSGAASRRDRLI